jgi:hypothetical protein
MLLECILLRPVSFKNTPLGFGIFAVNLLTDGHKVAFACFSVLSFTFISVDNVVIALSRAQVRQHILTV